MQCLLKMTESELFGAIERFTEKLRNFENISEFDEIERQSLSILNRVYLRFKNRIGREESFMLSWGEIYLALFDKNSAFDKDLGSVGLEAACVAAHREYLRPPRQYERHHVFIDEGNDDDQPVDPVEPDDDAVMRALEALSAEDNLLLREFYIGEKTAKELAADKGGCVGEDAIRQRIHRAKLKFKRFYKEKEIDDDCRIPANISRHAAENGENFHEPLGISRHDPGGDRGHL